MNIIKNVLFLMMLNSFFLMPAMENQGRIYSTIFQAIRYGDAQAVEAFIAKNPASAYQKDVFGHVPLLCAAYFKHPFVVQRLLKANADLLAVDGDGNGVMLHATRPWEEETSAAASYETVLILMNARAPIDHADKNSLITPLMYALQGGNRDVIALLLQEGADFQAADKRGQSVFDYAVIYGRTQVVALLLNCLPEVINKRNSEGVTPLLLAAEHNHSDMVHLLLRYRADPRIQSTQQDTFLLTACGSKNADLALWALHAYPHDIVISNSQGETPLLVAAHKGHYAVVEELLAHKADLCVYNNFGQSVLLCACASYNTPLVRMLLNKCSEDINTADHDGLTPLAIAAFKNAFEIVEVLLNNGASLNVRIQDDTLLNFLISHENNDMVQLLLERNASVNEWGQGYTPLMTALSYTNKILTRVLLAHGARVDVAPENSLEKTPLMAALKNQWYDIAVSMLATYHAHVDFPHKTGETALMRMAQEGNHRALMLLLAYDAEVTCIDNRGYDALAYGVNGGAPYRVIKLLLKAGSRVKEDAYGLSRFVYPTLQNNYRVTRLLAKYAIRYKKWQMIDRLIKQEIWFHTFLAA